MEKTITKVYMYSRSKFSTIDLQPIDSKVIQKNGYSCDNSVSASEYTFPICSYSPIEKNWFSPL